MGNLESLTLGLCCRAGKPTAAAGTLNLETKNPCRTLMSMFPVSIFWHRACPSLDWFWMREASASLKFAKEFSIVPTLALLIQRSDHDEWQTAKSKIALLFLWKVHIPHWSRLWTTDISPPVFKIKKSCIDKINCEDLILSANIIISLSVTFLSSFLHHNTNFRVFSQISYSCFFSWWCLVWGGRQERRQLVNSSPTLSFLLDIRPHF